MTTHHSPSRTRRVRFPGWDLIPQLEFPEDDPLPESSGMIPTDPGSSAPAGRPLSTPPALGDDLDSLVMVGLPSFESVQRLDLTRLRLDKVHQGALNLGRAALGTSRIDCLDLSDLGLRQILLGVGNKTLTFWELKLDLFGIDPPHLSLGVVDLGRLEQGVLDIGLLDPAKLDLGNSAAGILELSALTPLPGPSGVLEVFGIPLPPLEFIDLTSLRRPDLGLAICDLTQRSQKFLRLGIVDLGGLGLRRAGLGFLRSRPRRRHEQTEARRLPHPGGPQPGPGSRGEPAEAIWEGRQRERVDAG